MKNDRGAQRRSALGAWGRVCEPSEFASTLRTGCGLADSTAGTRALISNGMSLTAGTILSSTPALLMDALREKTATGPQIVVALDLEDLMQPQMVKERANQMESLKNAKVNIDEVVKTVLGMKGLKFSVTVKEKATEKITVDFSGDASGYGYNANRYSGARQQQAERNAIRARETGQAAMTGTDIRKQIQDPTSEIRRKMTDRYKVQF